MQKPLLPFLLGGQRGFTGRSSSATAAWLLQCFPSQCPEARSPPAPKRTYSSGKCLRTLWCWQSKDEALHVQNAWMWGMHLPLAVLSWVFLPQSLLLSTWAALSSHAHLFPRYGPKEGRCHTTAQSLCWPDVQQTKAYNKTSPNEEDNFFPALYWLFSYQNWKAINRSSRWNQ